MLKILVADDEPRQRKVLANIIRNARPLDEIIECRNGEEALSAVMNNDIDVMFTDIHMPMMDGLTMMEIAQQRGRRIKTIIVSGYSHFEYARKAITLGAYDYLLKPIEQEKIEAVLERIRLELDQERRRKAQEAEISEQLSQSLPAWFEYLMNKWVTETLTASEVRDLTKILPERGAGLFLCTHAGRKAADGSLFNPDELSEIHENIKHWIKQGLDAYGNVLSFVSLQKPDVIVTLLFRRPDSVDGTGAGIDAEAVRASMEALAASVGRDYGAALSIGVGEPFSDFRLNVRASWETASKACEWRFYRGLKCIVSWREIAGDVRQPAGGISRFAEEKVLLRSITEGDRTAVEQTIDALIARILDIRHPEPAVLKDLLAEILIRQVYEFRNSMEDDQANDLSATVRNEFEEARPADLAELRDLCVRLAGLVTEMVSGSKGGKNEQMLQKCLEYIDAHYAEDLSLEALSRMFYFNASYFSIWFKKYTKLKFSDYLPAVRVEKAKELLRGTDRKVYEIANQVGYRDSRYFNQIFKKLNGVTPDEFRRINAVNRPM